MINNNNFTKNLSRHEFKCNCGCGLCVVDYMLVNILQDTCDHFEEARDEPVKIIINSGCRCVAYNRYIRGSLNSYHCKGMASDFVIYYKLKKEKIPPSIIHEYLDQTYPDLFGMIEYANFNHLDSRWNDCYREIYNC
jgi:hypothetical protein